MWGTQVFPDPALEAEYARDFARQWRSYYRIGTTLLPALFAAFPGDVVTLADTPTGAAGNYDVARSSCFADGERAGTEIILKTRGE